MTPTRYPHLALIAGRPVTRVPHDCKAFRAAPRPAHVVLHAVRVARWIAVFTLAGLATWALLAGGLSLDVIFGALP